MADPQVKIIMSLVDNVSANMKKITGTTGSLGTAFQQLTGFSLGAAGGIALVGMGLQKGIKLAKESVTEWVKYNQAMREMGQATGLGVEEISRIVQVGDDWMISQEAIRTSLQFMNKKGITPSIDNLAALADEYVATADKSAFAEKAVTILGRGYTTLIPLLALGGQGFRDATAAIEDNLIATEKSIEATRKYEVIMDTLADTATGLKNELAVELIPTINDLGTGLLGQIKKTKAVDDATDDLWRAQKQGLISWVETFAITTLVQNGLKDVSFAEEVLLEITGRLDKGERDLNDTTSDLAFAYNQELAPALSDAREDMGGMTENEIADQIRALGELKTAAENYASALQTLTKTGIDALTESMAEQIRKEALLDYWQGEITLGTYQQIVAGTSQLKNVEALNEAYEDNKITEIEWMAIMADNIVTSEELSTAIGGTATAAATLATNVATAHQYMHDFDGTTATVTINHIDTYTDVNNPVNYPGAPTPSGKAGGANFVVPPGYDNDNYPLGTAKSGERVIVIPRGEAGNTTNNFSMNIHTNAQSSSLMRDFNKMRAWVG